MTQLLVKEAINSKIGPYSPKTFQKKICRIET